MFKVKFEAIYWHCSEWQPAYNIPNGIFKEGIPKMNGYAYSAPNLIIIKDLMLESNGRVAYTF